MCHPSHLQDEEGSQVGSYYKFLLYTGVAACVLFALGLYCKLPPEHPTLISQPGKNVILWQSAIDCVRCESLSVLKSHLGFCVQLVSAKS